MTQSEFHRRYEACPPHEKWELIGGIVYMASPLRYPHGKYDLVLGTVLGLNATETPGVDGAHNATSILGETSEPQPDLALRVAAEFGGNSRINDQEYLEGPPEFIAEIAYSSLDIDMHRKREDYERAGVAEYLVVCIEEQELHWFDFRTGRPLRPTRQGVYRSRVFPGLWIDGGACSRRTRSDSWKSSRKAWPVPNTPASSSASKPPGASAQRSNLAAGFQITLVVASPRDTTSYAVHRS
jgi:hypothetical protein